MDDAEILAILDQSIMDSDEDPDSADEDPFQRLSCGERTCC